jgi:hypothetical protein
MFCRTGVGTIIGGRDGEAANDAMHRDQGIGGASRQLRSPESRVCANLEEAKIQRIFNLLM